MITRLRLVAAVLFFTMSTGLEAKELEKSDAIKMLGHMYFDSQICIGFPLTKKGDQLVQGLYLKHKKKPNPLFGAGLAAAFVYHNNGRPINSGKNTVDDGKGLLRCQVEAARGHVLLGTVLFDPRTLFKYLELNSP